MLKINGNNDRKSAMKPVHSSLAIFPRTSIDVQPSEAKLKNKSVRFVTYFYKHGKLLGFCEAHVYHWNAQNGNIQMKFIEL